MPAAVPGACGDRGDAALRRGTAGRGRDQGAAGPCCRRGGPLPSLPKGSRFLSPSIRLKRGLSLRRRRHCPLASSSRLTSAYTLLPSSRTTKVYMAAGGGRGSPPYPRRLMGPRRSPGRALRGRRRPARLRMAGAAAPAHRREPPRRGLTRNQNRPPEPDPDTDPAPAPAPPRPVRPCSRRGGAMSSLRAGPAAPGCDMGRHLSPAGICHRLGFVTSRICQWSGSVSGRDLSQAGICDKPRHSSVSLRAGCPLSPSTWCLQAPLPFGAHLGDAHSPCVWVQIASYFLHCYLILSFWLWKSLLVCNHHFCLPHKRTADQR